MTSNNFRILCVDDEINVLDAFRRTLRKDFDVSVAEGGDQALAMIAGSSPFAIVLSDMRMPGMNGIQFLMQVKKAAPQTVRMMLTGNSDQQTAIDAVNQGSIFRFLTKPCPPETLVATLNDGIEQYRLIMAEKQLLEETLNQSIQVLLDILSIVNPTAFSRSGRVKKIVRDLAERLGVEKVWEIEFAAMLSQIGCVAVPEEILQKVASRMPLSNKETGLYSQHPLVGRDLIARIPRMENVAEIIAGQNRRIGEDQSQSVNTLSFESGILRVALDFDRFVSEGLAPQNAAKELLKRGDLYDPRILSSLQETAEASHVESETLDLPVRDLKSGMFLSSALISMRGSTLLPAGQEITSSLILRMANLVQTGIVSDKFRVEVPIMRSNAVSTF